MILFVYSKYIYIFKCIYFLKSSRFIPGMFFEQLLETRGFESSPGASPPFSHWSSKYGGRCCVVGEVHDS